MESGLEMGAGCTAGAIVQRETRIYVSVEDLCLHLSHESVASCIKFWKILFLSRIIHT